ncbi:MAG: hypothetical protein ACI8X5_003548 [Planctomycetota bacterium]|jgi:hypothetical protein
MNEISRNSCLGVLALLIALGFAYFILSDPDELGASSLFVAGDVENATTTERRLPITGPRIGRRTTTEKNMAASAIPGGSSSLLAHQAELHPLTGRVVDDLGSAFLGARVSVRDAFGVSIASLHPNGSGEFYVDLKAGVYVASIDESSLPAGFHAPLEIEVDRHSYNSVFEAQEFEIPSAEGPTEIVLTVFRSAVIQGQVVDSLGDPMQGAYVSLSYAGTDHMPMVAYGSTQTDEAGNFELTQPYPGNYRLNVQDANMNLSEKTSALAPVVIELSIEAGQIHDVGVLQLGGAGISAQGRIVDQDGNPFAGMLVKAFPHMESREGWRPIALSYRLSQATTDLDGIFLLENLPQRMVRIQLEGDYELPLGERKAAFFVDPVYADLQMTVPGGTLDVGDHQLLESRPFRLEVTFKVDPDWAAAQGIDPNDLGSRIEVKVELENPERSAFGLSRVEYREAFAGYPSFSGGTRLTFDKETLELHWITETPRGPCILKIEAGKKRSKINFDYKFTPRPSRTETVTIQIPSK